mmetsp:Transcript_87570/g.223035  ORF Transcript_87570/g.223035 Transcript_87570/m.223035 type:complete len:311 (-) Transcript_87570:215-1147(-)
MRTEPLAPSRRDRESGLLVRLEHVALPVACPDLDAPLLVVDLGPAAQHARRVFAEGVDDDHLFAFSGVQHLGPALLDQGCGDRVGQRRAQIFREALQLRRRRKLAVLLDVLPEYRVRRAVPREQLRCRSFRWRLQQQVAQGPLLGRRQRLVQGRGLAPPPDVVVPEQGPVDQVPPMRIITFEAQLHDRLILIHHLADGFLRRPAKELPHLLLVGDTDRLESALAIRLDAQRQLAHGVRVETIALQVELQQSLVLSQGLGKLQCLYSLQVGVGQGQHLQVGIRFHGLHQLRRDALLDVAERHLHVGEVQLD